MRARGWIERSRQWLPAEQRVLVTLWHPRQPLGEGTDRHHGPAVTHRSLPTSDQQLTTKPHVQLALFDSQ